MSNNTNPDTDTDSEPDTKRRRLLQTLGIGGIGLAATGPAAAHPHGPHKSASGQSELSSDDEVEESEDNGHGYGEWCQSTGFGNGMRRGHGYRRRFPHTDDETEWDDWQPGDGRPPWADNGNDEDDEDESEDDSDDGSDSDTEEPEPEETYDLTVVIADPDGVPVPDVSLTVEGTVADTDETRTEEGTTDDNGLGHFDLPNGTYTLTVDGESTDYTAPDPTEVTVDGDDVAVTIDLAEAEEDPVDAETEVDEGDSTESDDADENADPTEGTEEGTDDPEEQPEPTDDSTPDEEEQTVANTIEDRIHEVTNTYRESQDVSALEFSDELAEVARSYSEVMATEGSFSHTSPNGDGPGDRLEAAGLECERWAENIAWESGDRIHEPEDDAESIANSVAEGWINSDGHRENILGNYSEEGVGVFIDAEAGEAFVTQLFCTPVESPSDESNSSEDGSQSAEETTDG